MIGWRPKVFSIIILVLVVGCSESLQPSPSLWHGPLSFADLPGWDDDGTDQALHAFARSCASRNDQPIKILASNSDRWNDICRQAVMLTKHNQHFPDKAVKRSRDFFHDNFVPWKIIDGQKQKVLFTGYYEPILPGSFNQSERFNIPIYRVPDDLQRDGNKRYRWHRQEKKPYFSRQEIMDGALDGHGLEILWLDDPWQAFLLSIQGSGRIILDNGQTVFLSYADRNGHPYRSIGKILAQYHGWEPKKVTLSIISNWLSANPDKLLSTLTANPSYIFFQLHSRDPSLGPTGAIGHALSPGRSIAVDPDHLPLRYPIWINTKQYKRLTIAQDTGSAIKGRLRADIFWGWGDQAAHQAGQTRLEGSYYLLAPRP